MKVKISFEIDYDDPENDKSYMQFMDIIKNYYEDEMIIPTSENVSFIELSQINITDDYKSPEKKE